MDNEGFPYPRTIRQVGVNVANGAPYASMMKEFIDSLIRDLRAKGARRGAVALPVDSAMIAEEPPRLDDPVHRVHLAGMAEHIARIGGMSPPEWTEKPEFFLAEPVFMGGESGRHLALAETPGPFRRRQLFCGRALAKLSASLEE
jgi:hypothetical protein